MERVPLLFVGGAAGAGKSTICARLQGTIAGLVMLESDVLWDATFEARHDAFVRTWLRIAGEIGRSGLPVAIFGAGFVVPHNIEGTPERAQFAAVHYLGLTCDDEVLEKRIRARPPPRCTSDAHIAEQVAFNRWVRANGATSKPAVTVLDTTTARIEETSSAISRWMERCCKVDA
jgi:broad-specificity NMP kinase